MVVTMLRTRPRPVSPVRLVRRLAGLALLCLLPVAPLALAQTVAPTPVAPPAAPPRAPAGLGELKYRSIGPAAGGRVARVSGVPGDPLTYYAATASGGVWKSSDGGFTWKSIFDEQPISSIGSIAVAPSDPNVVYVGSGEANIRGNVAPGNGIYKSVDAGKTWTHVWKQEGQIGTMIVHPSNPDIAFASVLGHAFGPNPERGVYRTRDGGRTWTQVLRKDADTGASSVAFDPTNPNILFAGLWQARRQPWGMTSAGPGSGLYVSRDGGDTWTQLTGKGLPDGIWGKVGVAVAPSDARRVYALIEHEQGGLFRSDDGGATWKRVNAHRALRQRPWYYSTLTVDPVNANDVWFPQVSLYRTIDGGATIRPVKIKTGWDHHDIWIDPRNPKRIVDGSDAGVNVSEDGGETWRAPLLPISQFYHVSVDTRVPFHVAGAIQDLGTLQGPSQSLTASGISRADWHTVGGGEAGHVVSDPSDPDIVYAGEYLGIITRYDHRTRQVRNISAWPEYPSGWAAEQMRYRFQWTAPIAISPHDPRIVYHGANVLFRTSDGGQTWTAISPDLTRNDKTRQRWSGGPITGDNTGVETYCTIFAVAESPREKGLIWAGSDDGLVHVTRDGGGTWTNVTPGLRGLPEWGTVSMIEASPFDAGTAYVVVDAHRLDDMRPYLFRTTDYGKTWTRLDARLPQDVYLHAVREDPAQRGTLYLGTERGVMLSSDAGATWQPLQLNLPTVAVHDLVVKDNSLVVGTHGRSIWILDDLVPVRGLTAALAEKPLHLFPVADTVAWRAAGEWTDSAPGANPPRGAAVYYHLKQDTKEPAILEVLDAGGAVIRTLRSVLEPLAGSAEFEEAQAEERKPALATAAGLHRATWDLRAQGSRKIKDSKLDGGDPEAGPPVLPGTYTLRLTAAGQTATTTVRVLPDPRTAVSDGDRRAQLDFVRGVHDDVNRLTDMVENLRTIRQQLTTRKTLLGKGDAKDRFGSAADALVARIDALDARMHNPKAEIVYDILAMKGGANLYSRLSQFLDYAGSGDGAPTQGMREVHAEMRKELDGYATEYDTIVGQDVAALNRLAGELGLTYISAPR
jgi:photosystem II stability/assembly factor-like uncharacterized protein